MRKTINVGVIGLGRLGSLYASYLRARIPHVNLRAVSDLRETVAQTFAQENNVPKWFKDYRDLLAEKDVDSVIVVTPTSTHKEVVIEAARQGKAIFCEKPLALSLDEAEAMSSAIEQ